LNEIVDNEQACENMDKVINDVGPEIANNILENDECTNTYIESDASDLLQIDRIQQVVKMDWPNADNKPINEFDYDGLCSMTFPCLFPYGLGDPTKKARKFEVTETDGFKHLLKYATKHSVSETMYYPFAKHPRFKFWAYDRLRRHRGLCQSKVYLDQNIGTALFIIIR
jgi:hypothetical protein